MKALVSGATGFVGAAVARALLKQGWQVRALARAGSDRRNLRALALEVVSGDLADRDSLDRAASGCEALFHVAAFEVEHGRPVGLVALVINETGSYGWFPAVARQLLFDVPEGAGPQKRFWTLKLAEATARLRVDV